MKVASRRDNFFRILIFGAIFICFVPMVFIYKRDGVTTEFLVASTVIMAVAGLLLWMWHHTYYCIESGFVKYFSGPFKGKVEISKITEITINKTSYVGLKFGLAKKGITITSTSHMDLYITPKNPPEFVDEILKQNPTIKIKT